MNFDIIIIGGGPAGATLARLLPPGFSVLIIGDRKEKLCGGLLSPDSQKFFTQNNMTLPADIFVEPQISAVDTFDLEQNLQRRYKRFYVNINRAKFDGWLWSLIPQTVGKTVGKAKKIRPADGGYIVEYTENAEIKTAFCKYLVGADGANSLVRRTFFPDFEIRKYIAIQQTFSAGTLSPFYSCVFDATATDCCAWHITKEDKILFGGAFAPKKIGGTFALNNPRKSFEKIKERLASVDLYPGETEKTEACIVLRPKSVREILLGGKNIFFIGEAAGFISPSSLEGISRAMYSAKALANAFKGENVGKLYKKQTFSLRFGIFLKLLKCPFLYNPFLRKIVMMSGIQ